MAKTSYLEDNNDTVAKFTRAIQKAQDWVEENNAEEVAKVIQPYFEDTNLEIITMTVERYKEQESYATDTILDEEEWNNLKNIMKEAGELPADIAYETLVNTQFATDAAGK